MEMSSTSFYTFNLPSKITMNFASQQAKVHLSIKCIQNALGSLILHKNTACCALQYFHQFDQEQLCDSNHQCRWQGNFKFSIKIFHLKNWKLSNQMKSFQSKVFDSVTKTNFIARKSITLAKTMDPIWHFKLQFWKLIFFLNMALSPQQFCINAMLWTAQFNAKLLLLLKLCISVQKCCRVDANKEYSGNFRDFLKFLQWLSDNCKQSTSTFTALFSHFCWAFALFEQKQDEPCFMSIHHAPWMNQNEIKCQCQCLQQWP